MGRSQRNDNFIDKTFTIVADILLKILPASKQEKQAFFYYRDGILLEQRKELFCLRDLFFLKILLLPFLHQEL